jgi:hypothetical protein
MVRALALAILLSGCREVAECETAHGMYGARVDCAWLESYAVSYEQAFSAFWPNTKITESFRGTLVKVVNSLPCLSCQNGEIKAGTYEHNYDEISIIENAPEWVLAHELTHVMERKIEHTYHQDHAGWAEKGYEETIAKFSYLIPTE